MRSFIEYFRVLEASYLLNLCKAANGINIIIFLFLKIILGLT